MNWGYIILAIVLVAVAVGIYEVYAFFEGMLAAAKGVMDDIIRAITALYNDIVHALGDVLNFFEGIPAFLDEALGTLQNDLLAGLHDAQTALASLNDQLQTWGSYSAQQLAGMKTQIADTVNGAMSTVQHGVQAAQGAMNGMQHAIIQAASLLSSEVKSTWATVQSDGAAIVNGAANAAKSIGSDLARL